MVATLADPSIGYGTGFKLAATPGGTLTELVGVFELKPPSDTFDRVEVTHYKSPQKRKQYINGLKDAADFTAEMNYSPGSPTDLLCQAALNDGLSRGFEADIPDAIGGTWKITGSCIVRGYERNLPNGDRKTATITIGIDGALTEAAAS